MFTYLKKEFEKGIKIVIYGYGKIGKMVEKECKRKDIEIAFFIETQPTEKKTESGRNIFSIYEVKPDEKMLIVIAVSLKYHSEIIDNLKEAGIFRYIVIDDQAIKKMQEDRKYLYIHARHERNTLKQYQDEYLLETTKSKEDFQELCSHLDEENIKIIEQLLDRIRVILSCSHEEIDIFSPSEKRKIEILQNNFYSEIIREGQLYRYKEYVLPKKYFDPLVLFYQYGMEWFSEETFTNSKDILDCGAFIGDTSLLFAKKTKGKVYALEPMESNCSLIRETIRLNNVDNIEIINEAVGRKSGKSIISKNAESNWSTMVPYDSRQYTEETVGVTSIDDFVKKRNIQLELIKLHVEGMEYDAVQGAEETMISQKPALIIHLHHTATDFFKIIPYLDKLNLGYQFKIYKPVTNTVFTGTILLAEVKNKEQK